MMLGKTETSLLTKLLSGFELANTHARLNLKAEARKTYLSYLWWIIEPTLYVAIFYFVFTKVLENGRPDFVLFLVVGKIPFLWIAKGITNSADSILRNKGLLSQASIQPALFPLVVLQQNFYKQIPVFVLLIAFIYIYGVEPSVYWLWFFPLVIITYLFVLPIALIGALLTSFIPDVRILLSLSVIFLMFVSGIFWDIRQIQDQALQQIILNFNPVAFLLDAYRASLIYHESPNLQHIAWLLLAIVAMIILSAWLYQALRSAICNHVIND